MTTDNQLLKIYRYWTNQEIRSTTPNSEKEAAEFALVLELRRYN